MVLSKKALISSKKTTTSTTKPAVKPVKVKPVKVKPVKVQKQSHKPVFADFQFETSGDINGIHITILYQGNAIHKFSLLKPDFQLWMRMPIEHRFVYVLSRVHSSTFDNNQRIVNYIVATIAQILDDMFAEARQAQNRRLWR